MGGPLARGARLTGTAVVIVNWNRADLTIRAARAVLDDRGPDDVEVVVVDNGSSDDSFDVLGHELPGVRLVRRDTNGGFAAGVTSGIAATGAERIVLLNNDAVPSPGFVRALGEHLDRAAPEVAAVTGRILLAGRWTRLAAGASATAADGALRDHDGTRWIRSADGDVRLNSTGVRVDRDGNGSDRDWLASADTVAATDVFGFSGGAAMLRRTALEDVGGFDESLFMYYEDTELSWRLARRGWRVEHAADAVVEHDHSASSGVHSDLFVFRNARNRMLVAIWHASVGTAVRAVARSAVRGLRGSLRSRDRREARLVLAALADVLGHLPRALARRAHESARASVPRSAVDPAS